MERAARRRSAPATLVVAAMAVAQNAMSLGGLPGGQAGKDTKCTVWCSHTAQEMRGGGGDAGNTYGGSRVSGCATGPKQLRGARQLDPGAFFWMCIKRRRTRAPRANAEGARESRLCVQGGGLEDARRPPKQLPTLSITGR